MSVEKNKVLELSTKRSTEQKTKNAVIDPDVLKFLYLQEKAYYTEIELESRIIDRLQKFLMELQQLLDEE